MKRRRDYCPETPPLLLVTAAILVAWSLYRFALFLSVQYRCVSMSEIWFDSGGTRWPLFGVFALVFLLLLAWDLTYLRNPNVRKRHTDLAIVVLNAVALLAIGIALTAQVRASSIRFYYRQGAAAWNTSGSPFGSSNTCELASKYLGTWEVVSRKKPTWAQNFPSEWIEFHRDLTFDAADSDTPMRGSGWWSPTGWTSILWLSSDAWGDSIWEPSFSEDGILLLATPSFEPDAVTRVVLRRANGAPY